MDRQPVYVVHAEGEESQAELLAQPLRDAGYDVTHNGTIVIGESLIGSAMRAVAGGAPIVLCATARASGSAWAHQIVNAGHSGGRTQVFVVQMESQAFVEQLALRAKVARYCDDPAAAVRDLLTALAKHFPPATQPLPARIEWLGERMDAPSSRTDLDLDTVRRFRDQLRPEVAARHPGALEPWKFLERAGLVVNDVLTATGVLLFGRNPTALFPAAVVKCVHYYGPDRSALRDTETFEGTVIEQITLARDFVARHARRGEHPSAAQARSVDMHDYPMIAVREIIANALVHRDYGKSDTCVHVRIFHDRLEISSPGSWPGREIMDGVELSLADLNGQSIKRNFRLAHVLSWIRMVEGEGSGIPTSLRDCTQAQSQPPTVHYNQDVVTVTLRPRPPDFTPPRARREVVPRQLPAPPGVMVGRATELAYLDRILDEAGEAAMISSIGGAGGIGKTWLALSWAHRHLNRFPDGQLYVDLHGFSPHSAPLSPTVVIRGFLDALGVEPDRIPTELDAQAALYRSLVADKRLLIVLDNAATTAQVVPLLPGNSTCTVLVTTRHRLASMIDRYGARQLTLDTLTRGEAHALLTARLGVDRVETEPDAIDHLVELCEGYPLALSITARQAAARPNIPLAEVAAELRELGLDMLDGDDPAASLSTVLSWSLRQLTDEQRTVFGLLGIAPGPDTGLPAAAALTGLPPARTRTTLSALEDASLVERRPGGRYAMHDLVRDYAATIPLPEGVREAALARAVDFHMHTAFAADRLLDPHRPLLRPDPPVSGLHLFPLADAAAAMAWMEAEHATLLAAQRAAAILGRHQVVWHLAWALETFHTRRGHLHDALATWRAAMDAAAHLPDSTARIRTHRHLGNACSRLGLHDEATGHLEQALALALRHQDLAQQAHTHQALAYVWERRGNDNQALNHAQQALGLHRTLNQPVQEASALNAVGWHAALVGDFDTARDHCHAALALHRQHHNTEGEAETLNSLGFIAHRTDHHRQAVDQYHQALTLYRTLGNTYQAADTVDHMGHSYTALAQNDQAHAAWMEALELYREQGRDADALRVRHQLDDLNRPTDTRPSSA
ncbi:tetratricopeptide repeat protein [Saccharothrix lopnurensis]|uniref:Tetratricopeptide repeat protein n=1 Tax=Saccharothrix lopnurensis TaxID=1670621 RepID=A0ABW1PGE4_9PSEU